MKNPSTIFLSLLISGLFFGCQSNEIADSSTVDQNSIYQDYTISYSERTGYTTVRAAFRHAGPNGTTLLLSDSSYVTFNGHKMVADSNFLSGVFYSDPSPEKLKTGQALRFEFKDTQGKKYRNSYKLNVMKIVRVPTQIAKGTDLVLDVSNQGVFVGEQIRVRLEDQQNISSCLANLTNGKLTVYAKDLKLFNGKVTLEITREYKEEVKEAGSEGGNCMISYEYPTFEVDMK